MFHRTIERDLLRLATQYPVVTLTGPRQAGKTTLCKHAFKNYDYANLEDLDVRHQAIDDPRGFLSQYRQGVVLDEIQRAPDLPSYIQTIVDSEERLGRFILTGSQQFELTDKINQSLAGRTAILRLLPLSYFECYSNSALNISEILYKGFYPRIISKNLNPTEAYSFYVNTYVERDLRSLIHIKELQSFERFLKLCASQIGQLINYSRLANDCGVNQNTIKSWLSILNASYITFQVQPHFNNFRKRLTKSTKLYFYDVGLAAYLLNLFNPDILLTHPLRGALFENFIMTEFLKNQYNHAKNSNLYFFRDHVGNEIDLILDYGQYTVAIEIKSSSTVANDFMKGLMFYKSIAKQKVQKLVLVYAGDRSYTQGNVSIYSYKDLTTLFDELII